MNRRYKACLMSSVLSTFWVTACGSAPIAYTAASQKINEKLTPKTARCADDSKPSSGSASASDCVDVQSNTANGELNSILSLKQGIKTFSVKGGQPPPSDFVFVVDSSASMDPLLESFINGFEAIPASAYPHDSRMAVMNMIAHSLDNSQKPLAAEMQLPIFKTYFPALTLGQLTNFISAEPGYLGFINAARVAQFKSVSAANGLGTLTVEKYSSYDLCESSWFLPGQKNNATVASKKKTCLGAAMQISSIVGVESGLMSVQQMLNLQKNNQPLFRKNASVHFVFISDTHDPGNPNVPNLEQYMSELPSFQSIENAVKKNSPEISFVKIHGVVPFTACKKSEWNQVQIDINGIYGGSYLPRIQASGGVAVDMCSDSVNYKAVVNQLFNETRKLAPFQLAASNVKNVAVTVNGASHTDFKLLGNSSVEVNGLLSSQDYEIEIKYEY